MRVIAPLALSLMAVSGWASSLGSALEVDLGLTAMTGLEGPLRGGRLDAGIGFRDLPLLPALELSVDADRGLRACIIGWALVLGLGPGLELRTGGLLPLQSLRGEVGEGRSLTLTPAEGLSTFGLAADFGAIHLAGTGLRLEGRAFLEYSALRLQMACLHGQPGPFRKGDSLVAFSLGFKGGLGLRVAWSPAKGGSGQGGPRP